MTPQELQANVEQLARERDEARRRVKDLEAARAAEAEKTAQMVKYHKWELDTLAATRDQVIRERDAARARVATVAERVKQLEHALERVMYFLAMDQPERANNAALAALEEKQ